MKKNIFASIILVALTLMATVMPASAQDGRQRTLETIVSDVLAQMPAQKAADLAADMQSLAAAAPESVIRIASTLGPASQGHNSRAEYALDALASFASDPANAEYKAKVVEGFDAALKACEDKTNKQFLAACHDRLTATPLYAPLPQVPQESGDLLKALKGSDRIARVAVLEASPANEEIFAKLAKKYKSLSDEAKVDVLNWLGSNKAESQLPLIISAMDNMATAGAAMKAASRIGGDKAALALVGKLDRCDAALLALRSVKCDNLESIVLDEMDKAQGDKLIRLMTLASAKKMKAASPAVFAATESSDASVSSAALAALAGVVAPADADRLAALLSAAPEAQVPALSNALLSSLRTLSPAESYEKAVSYASKAAKPELFYGAIAQSSTDDAVEYLAEIGTKPALDALTKCRNPRVVNKLLKAAADDESYIGPALGLADAFVPNPDSRYAKYAVALAAAKSPEAKKMVVRRLASVPTMRSFLTAGSFLDSEDFELAYAAAVSAKSIAVATNDVINYTDKQEILKKAREIYRKNGDTDDAYAVDEITKLLSEPAPSYESNALTPEEAAQGFELLFDGENLDKWVGNKVGYTPVNGAIYVTANYGNELNLYTEKEYRNFVYRFEFCFTEPGVNNGVGIRTPIGVDAAYDAMCEVQILDHDDPIYEGLREYQVHGSVYGVIPAKRIVHKPLGEWSEEEIRVEGDHITVTVNGEVIVDGNVREACQGHNVAPDGSSKNPYTVDHLNHPGMFNEKGHVSFCGHGAGLRFRNIRILDLDAAAAAAKAKKSSKKRK